VTLKTVDSFVIARINYILKYTEVLRGHASYFFVETKIYFCFPKDSLQKKKQKNIYLKYKSFVTL